ncbi:MAG: UDP-glucose/GDP-mannose dehydrogenase family protein [Myxococcales bacterium]|nr:UDP-glucose/GDP-mannose dehydrogenase family protein [Myxococcales bacterium]
MDICMVGTGYVGLVSGAGFAEMGNTVCCVDLNAAKIAVLEKGEVPFFEPGLAELVKRNVEQKRLSFSTDLSGAVRDKDLVFVAVGTPQRSDGAANLLAVDDAVEQIARSCTKHLVLVIKSTVPVGTNARAKRIANSSASFPIHVVSNPEFLKEGDAIKDFLHPDRIIVGCDPNDEHAAQVMERLYKPLSRQRDRLLWMNPESAELTKYVANTMLALRISLMNELSHLCEKVGADINHIREGIGSDTRIGSAFLYAGPGYGGSCFPKDVAALAHMGQEHGVELEITRAITQVNNRQKGVLLRKLKRAFDGDIRGKRIAIWGAAFKPRTDDIRDSPALTLIEGLLSEGAVPVVHDPQALTALRDVITRGIETCDDAYQAVQGADALVLVTEWRQYQNPDFDRIKALLNRPVLIDGRNVWCSFGLEQQGFTYAGIGIKPLSPPLL